MNSSDSEISEEDSEIEVYSPEGHDTNFINKSSEAQINNIDAPASNNILISLAMICISLSFAFWVSTFFNSTLDQSPASIDTLKEIFPNQPNETFDDFETIINEIVFEKAVHPAVFLFLFEENKGKVDKLMSHLANYASSKLKTDNYINIPLKEFHTEEAIDDYGYLINKYKTDLIDKKVMLVKNLQGIPGQTAQVFHSFCDEISPLVERVVFIFTLKVDSLIGKEEKIAENTLKRVWSDLDEDILMPLITRVTSTVIKIFN